MQNMYSSEQIVMFRNRLEVVHTITLQMTVFMNFYELLLRIHYDHNAHIFSDCNTNVCSL